MTDINISKLDLNEPDIWFDGQEIKKGFPHIFTTDTPLVVQWLPKNYGWKVLEEYLERLSNWAKLEPQRRIKLVINGSGFTPKQLKELRDKLLDKTFNPNQNIDLIDFNELDLSEYDFSFHIQLTKNYEKSKCLKYTVLDYFKNLYSLSECDRLKFGIEIDSMRILMLLAVELPIIYFDFDIFPKENERLNKVKAEQGFLFDMSSGMENSVIAMSDAGKIKLDQFYMRMKHEWQYSYPDLKRSSHKIYESMLETTYGIMIDIETKPRSAEDLLNTLSKAWSLGKSDRDRIREIVGFQHKGRNIYVQSYKSWNMYKRDLYSTEELKEIEREIKEEPLVFQPRDMLSNVSTEHSSSIEEVKIKNHSANKTTQCSP
ncbi:hypothetical protein [Wolbachia endosymbiont of Pentidionis agamae]|uniref:hypothetical protein n=1 Tax=Wolbachia endosymbiont of Pentidionis agamae TaxID=3110435 RepID=UPI002FD41A49